jgi:hypothetical protein
MSEEKTINEITNLAEQVAKENGEFRAAIQEESKAEVALLEAVVEKVKPAFPAIANRVQCSYRSWWVGSVRTENEEHHFAWRGLYLNSDRPGPERYNPGNDQNRGSYEGTDYFLVCSDKNNPDNVGKFAAVTYSGHWSCWQGEGDEYSAECEVLSAEQVLACIDVKRILTAINTALNQQLEGKKTPRGKAATERAERVRALTKLL